MFTRASHELFWFGPVSKTRVNRFALPSHLPQMITEQAGPQRFHVSLSVRLFMDTDAVTPLKARSFEGAIYMSGSGLHPTTLPISCFKLLTGRPLTLFNSSHASRAGVGIPRNSCTHIAEPRMCHFEGTTSSRSFTASWMLWYIAHVMNSRSLQFLASGGCPAQATFRNGWIEKLMPHAIGISGYILCSIYTPKIQLDQYQLARNSEQRLLARERNSI